MTGRRLSIMEAAAADLGPLVRAYEAARRSLLDAIGGRSVVEGIGEYIALRHYGDDLAARNSTGYDVVAADGRPVQAKARTNQTGPQWEHALGESFDVSLCAWLWRSRPGTRSRGGHAGCTDARGPPHEAGCALSDLGATAAWR